MKIERLEYQDYEYKWKLEPIDFSPNLNLLVGVSGAGKTQIIRSIIGLKKIANGGSLNGVEWNIKFLSTDNISYEWKGQFETKKDSQILDTKSRDDEDNEFIIISESLSKASSIIVERNEKGIFFEGQKTPKLSPFQSVINLFSEEENIKIVREDIDRIISSNPVEAFEEIWRIPSSIFKKYEKSSLKEIKESELPLLVKLYLVSRYFPEIFNNIKQKFKEIFTKVEDIRIKDLKEDENIPLGFANFFKEAVIVNIKEKKIDNWIEQNYISSGMFKTLMYISELYLCPDNSVILIDEFENSLGVNCIDSVTDLILENKNLQFIITSHHPYIINNISPKYWQIVTRKGGCVTVKKAKDFHISESRQKAFIDLINVLENEEEEDIED